MANKVKKIPALGAAPTPEQQEEMARRAFLQKHHSLAEGIIFNAIASCTQTRDDGNGPRPDYRPIVDAAIDAADYIMERLYAVAVKVEE